MSLGFKRWITRVEQVEDGYIVTTSFLLRGKALKGRCITPNLGVSLLEVSKFQVHHYQLLRKAAILKLKSEWVQILTITLTISYFLPKIFSDCWINKRFYHSRKQQIPNCLLNWDWANDPFECGMLIFVAKTNNLADPRIESLVNFLM